MFIKYGHIYILKHTIHLKIQFYNKIIICFRTIQKLTLTDSSKLNEILEDIQNLICSRSGGQPSPVASSPDPSSHPELPGSHIDHLRSAADNLLPITPSPETSSYLSDSLCSSHQQPMHFSTPDKSADYFGGNSSKSMTSSSATADPALKNLLANFDTPTKVLDVSDYSEQ